VEAHGTRYMHSIEKPTYEYQTNAGIYCLSRQAVERVPKDVFFDMPMLFELLNAAGQNCQTFPINANWIDIGTHEEYERAQEMGAPVTVC
jgi:NDP-sugar pyrophosphorylase family protein